MKKILSTALIILFVTSCGGGGGGGGGSGDSAPTPSPTVNLSAQPTSVLLGNTSTLTWSSTNASSCSASWTSSTSTSGSEAVTINEPGNNNFSISCSGAGGSGSASVTVEGYRNTDGVVVDGYISGADVFIDENDNLLHTKIVLGSNKLKRIYEFLRSIETLSSSLLGLGPSYSFTKFVDSLLQAFYILLQFLPHVSL